PVPACPPPSRLLAFPPPSWLPARSRVAPPAAMSCRPCSARPRNCSRDCTEFEFWPRPNLSCVAESRYCAPLRCSGLCCHLGLPLTPPPAPPIPPAPPTPPTPPRPPPPTLPLKLL